MKTFFYPVYDSKRCLKKILGAWDQIKVSYFWYLRFSQKMNSFTAMVPQVELFLFGRIEDTKKKLTDLQLA